MSGVALDFSSVGEMEQALRVALATYLRDRSPENLRYFNLLYDAWERDDWKKEKDLALMEKTANIPTFGNSTSLLAEFASPVAINTSKEVTAILTEEREIFGWSYYFGASSEFNIIADDGLLVYITINGSDDLVQKIIKDSPAKLGTTWYIIADTIYFERPIRLEPGDTILFKYYNFTSLQLDYASSFMEALCYD